MTAAPVDLTAPRPNGAGHAATGVRALAVLDGPRIAEPLPELEYLVRAIGLVAGGGAPHLIAGFGFSGKTLAVQALLLALAAGRGVWGVYTGPPRRVLHVDLEQGERLTRRRYQRLARAMGVDLAALGDALAVVVMPRLTLAPEHADTWRSLMTGRDLIVIDSLRAATAGADENSSEIRAGLDMLGALSEETGCRVLVIHHARKPTADAPAGRYAIRGSGAIYDACDSVYIFGAEKGEPIKVEHVKARSHGEPVEDFALVIADAEVDGDPRGGLSVRAHGAELVTERREAKQEAKQEALARRDADRVAAALSSQQGASTTELRDLLGLDGKRFGRAVRALGDRHASRPEKVGRTTVTRHFIDGGAP